jgi:hypothetical protein
MIVTWLITSTITPALLSLVIRPVSRGHINYLPAGITPLLFAMLAQYHGAIPHVYKYKISTSLKPPAEGSPSSASYLTFSDKSYTYLPALQLSLSQFPGSLLSALIGWVVGYLWRAEILPAAVTEWRIPAWMVGGKGLVAARRGGEYDELRRRLETEAGGGTATGVQTEQRGWLGGLRERFGGRG